MPALVNTVVKGSPAEGAGIKAGDVITAVNGKAVHSADDLKNKQREEGERAGQFGHDDTAGPAVAVAPQQRQDEQEQPGGERELARPVDRPGRRVA